MQSSKLSSSSNESAALIWVYIGAFGATWGPVSWTLVSDIFPLSIRAKGASIGAFSNWINNFAIAFFVPPMFEAWAWGTYIFFAVFLFVGIFWVYFFLPETKNATLEEMDIIFKSFNGQEDAQMLADAQQEVGLTALLQGVRDVSKKEKDLLEVEHNKEDN
jgi:MFS family permease